MKIKELKETAQHLFDNRGSLITLWQEISNNFYPERADYSYSQNVGAIYPDDLLTSYPVMVRRDLGDQLGTMLRPTGEQWFEMGLMDDEYVDTEGKQFFDWINKQMRRHMYDPRTKFAKAMKQGDHDFANIGQCAVSVTPSRHATNLLFRNWHVKDVVWKENSDGDLTFIARRWQADARDLVNTFGDRVDSRVTRKAEKNPFDKVSCYHILCEADYYDKHAMGRPYWSIYYDCEHERVLEETPMYDMETVIPRWQTVSGSQYAYSPATITALADARLIQSITLSLLEAGEKAVNPPIVATTDVVKSDVSIYSGGITWVDRDYDERLGDALRPLNQDLRGLPFGFDMANDIRAQIRSIFYLDRLSLPMHAPEMTAYEVSQRVADYIRQAMPIFEPMEMEYNGQVCELTFQKMLRMGMFGDFKNKMPRSLSGKPYHFTFRSPFHETVEAQKGHKFQEAQALLAQAAPIDGTATAILDIKTALRDSLEGIGIPAKWTRPESDVAAIEESNQAQAAQQAELDRMEQGAEIAAKMGQVQGGAI